MENLFENYLKNENHQIPEDNINIIQENDEKKNKILFNEIIDDLIRKKTSKENMLKLQIEQNKKNLLQKFYSLSNINPPTIPNTQQSPQSQFQVQNKEPKKDIIPNNINPLLQEGQKEYDEMREKYKNERNKKKSSIFKSEDLHISNTNSVHLKKEDYSPINPNMVGQETKNNILIIQKKLFGDNEETSKVENIDEIDDLDFDDIDIKEFKNNDNNNDNNNDDNNKINENNIINLNNENDNVSNNNNNKMSNSNFNFTNLDTNNINFDLSSNIKSEIMNDNNLNEVENNFFPNEILKETRAVDYIYIAVKKKNEKIKEYKKQINRTKNFSVQLVSKLDYYRDEEKDNNKNNNISNNLNKYKKRKTGSENTEVMNEMNDLIKNLNLMNPNMNNNININNINNNININHANLAEIISQQQKINPKKINNNKTPKINQISNNVNKNLIKNNKKNPDHYINLNNNFNNINNLNYNTNTATTSNTTANKTNNISSSKKNNFSTNLNIINNNPIISSKTPNSIIGHNNKQNYKKILNNSKPTLNNLDINLNENIQNLQKVKTKAQIKINYRHISNSDLTQVNSNNNSNKRKRKNNSVIINNSNKRKDPKNKFYHYYTNTNNSNTNNNLSHNNNDINIIKNNIKNIINQIPSIYKNNPLTTKNKKISMANIINSKNILNKNINGAKKKNSYNNVNINTGNKFSTLNTLQKNNLIKFYRPNHQIEAVNKLKQQTYLGAYFIYAEKIRDNFLFKGIYKKSVSDINYICNKIYSGPSAPNCINYEKFFIFTENNKMELIQIKLSSISLFNLNKSIIIVKNE